MKLALRTFFLIILTNLVDYIASGPNNLHQIDGTSTAELIAGDIFFEIVDPDELSYTYRIRPARDFGASFERSEKLRNVPLVPVIPKYGCVKPSNNEEINGNVAFIERGECTFKTKALIAEMAGAKAVIITDTHVINEDSFIEMIDDDTDTDVRIPVGFLMGINGIMIHKTLKRLNLKYALINVPVNLTFTPVHKVNQPPWLGW